MSQHRPDRMLRSRGVAHGPVADQLLELRPASRDPGCLPAAEESEPSAASARSTHCRRRTCRKGRLSRRRPRSTTTARSPGTSKPAASPHRHQRGPPYSHRSPNRQSPDPPGRRPCDRLAAPLLLVDKVLSPRTPSIHRPVADPSGGSNMYIRRGSSTPLVDASLLRTVHGRPQWTVRTMPPGATAIRSRGGNRERDP